jgi:hypothetical protein
MRMLRKMGLAGPAAGMVALLAVLAAGAALLLPAPSSAIPICGYSIVRTFYCDAAMTVYSGTCHWACDGTSGCWGAQTQYFIQNLYECTDC